MNRSLWLLLSLTSCSSRTDGAWEAVVPALQMEGRLEGDRVILEDSHGQLSLRTVGFGRESLEPFEGAPAWSRGTEGEWWHGLGSGLAQGWTITERPEGHGLLTVEMEVDAGVDAWGGGAELAARDGSRWSYAGVQAEDADGRLLDAKIEGEDGHLRVRVDDQGARYPLRIDPVVTTAASSLYGASGDALGQTVAGGDVNGDGFSDWLVGAYRLSTRGAVYVYQGSTSGIGSTPNATLYPATAGYDGFFGWDIQSGDFNHDGYADVVVSEPEYNNGTFYVFMGSKNGLSTTASLVVAGSTKGERNGFALAVGDWNGDGYDDLASANPYRYTYGGADIYYGGYNGLSTNGSAKIDLSSSFQYIGYSAASGDFNHDGYDDLLLSHYQAASYYGKVYLFEGSSAGLSTSPSLTLTGPQVDIAFGREVGGLGDVNGDGYDDIGVGAPSSDLPYGDSGSMYVYYGGATGPGSNADATLYGVGYGDRFGWSIDGVGDADGDGYDDVVVGAIQARGGTYAAGAARVIPGSSSGLQTADEDTVYAGTTPYENYGTEVRGVGDINGDGFMDVSVGHPDRNSRAGAAYLYLGTDGIIDNDGDGYFTTGGSADCDDADASIHPNAAEVCDSVDQDCDGVVDDGVSTVYYHDVDGDGYGALADTLSACSLPTGYVSDATDCNDGLATIHPSAPEISADGVDQDCDGLENCYADQDYDGHGSSNLVPTATLACSDPGVATNADDCSDAAVSIYPGAPETVGDGVDQDCDGGDTCFVDGDGDGIGTASTVQSPDLSCADVGESAVSGDCTDADASVFPGAVEGLADGKDQDCDGIEFCYQDIDGDLYGSSAPIGSSDLDCLDAGEAAVPGDCNDLAPTIYPGGVEIPADGIDEDCDGGDTCYEDGDRDGFGSHTLVSSQTLDCSDAYESSVSSDCDDSNATIFPQATEQAADGVDGDCDGTESCYLDADDDGAGIYRTVLSLSLSCDDVGISARWDDCDDADPTRNPDAEEVPVDGIDSDCDERELCYTDADKDGFGESSTHLSTRLQCDAAGDSLVDGDCNDLEAGINPAIEELPADGMDADCDGTELCYVDIDGDGHGIDKIIAVEDISCSSGVSTTDDDCDDTAPSVYPGADEIPADGLDQDCDGGESCYLDHDGDGYGSGDLGGSANLSCNDAGEAISATDCDDDAAYIYPGSDESCDNLDDNCNGKVDEGLECDTKKTGCSVVEVPSGLASLAILAMFSLRRRKSV